MKKFLLLSFALLWALPAFAAPVGITVCQSVTTNGSCGRQEYTLSPGRAQVICEGTWGGASVQWTFATTSTGTLQSITGVALSSTTPSIQVDISYGEFIGATVSSAGSTSLTCKILPITK